MLLKSELRRGLILLFAGLVPGPVTLPLIIGGIQLTSPGSSWYYAVVGLILLGTASLLALHCIEALWLFAAAIVGTTIWGCGRSDSISGRWFRVWHPSWS